ncbi:MAG: hypothetical protein IKN04_03885 [Clostridia bacterium]|nr:hypothetical protein [Clostridia bacterium]
MRQEIKDLELEQVTGGRYFINKDKKIVVFQNVAGVFQLKCKPSEAMDAMDELIGKYKTEAEYDQACVNLLQSKGWI